ncbi:MAG: hypothetical protein K6T71_00545 [Candidatus Bipolaricaulota bacterium]|nr:hypothetical protein [Candidatus Bipolaricaulota bacterium]
MRKHLLWIGLTLVALAATLTVIYGEALREQLLRPLLYELWLWGLRLGSLPFALIWLVFLLVGSLGVYMTILDLVLHGRTRTPPQESISPTGPVQALAHRIELACHGELARWNVHRVVGEIAIRWIMLRHGMSESEARWRFREIFPELYSELDLEFPRSATQRSWLWLSAHLPISPQQRRARLREISRLTELLENFAGEAYESTRSHR